MLRFEMDVTAADVVGRTIEGVIVPYGEVGVVQGVQYRFGPGSIRTRSRVPLLLDHDRSRPVGVLARLDETERGAVGSFRVDATPAGDEALLQAASGSRGAFSIGAEVVQAADRGDGVLEITEGLVQEVSLLALGAFDSASVHRVAAEADEPAETEPELPADPVPANPDQLPLEAPAAEPEPEPDPDEREETPVEIEAAAPVLFASAARKPDLNAGELVGLMIRAQHGERDAARYLEAALVETISTDVTGLLPPQYEKSVLGAKNTPRPLYTFFRSRPLPGVGLAINKPEWTTPPVGAWAATVDADATSSKVVIGSSAASIERWDWAGAISWVVVQRSDPSIIDEIYAAAVDNFYAAVETRIATLLATAPTNAATSIGAAVAAYFTLNKRNPEGIIVAPDVWGKMADQKLIDATRAAGDISMNTEGMAGSWGGLPVFVSGNITATMGYLVTKRALDVRTTEPVRLTANAIGALNVELAVVGEALFDADYANEVMELAPTIPVGELAAAKAK